MILCVASQRVFIVIVYFVIDSVRIILNTLSYLGVICLGGGGEVVNRLLIY
jgi:hypothetical protein